MACGRTYKLVGNCCYGKCITNKDKFENVTLMNEREAMAAVNSPLFRKIDPVAKGVQ